MRNPWGRYEWKGAWSDKSKEWDENPLVKARLRPNLGDGADDGTFWMPFDKLVTGEAGFTKLDFCDRTTKRDLALKPKEDWGVCGIVWGAVSGLAKFVLCCRGVAVIYLGALSSHRKRRPPLECQPPAAPAVTVWRLDACRYQVHKARLRAVHRARGEQGRARPGGGAGRRRPQGHVLCVAAGTHPMSPHGHALARTVRLSSVSTDPRSTHDGHTLDTAIRNACGPHAC